MKLLLIIGCIFSVSVTTVRSLSCTECLNVTGGPCTEEPTVCPSYADSCVTSYTEVNAEVNATSNVTYHTLTRYCGLSNHSCGVAASMSSRDVNISTVSTCCNTDFCTPPNPILSSPNNTKNGLTCPACFETNATLCLPSKTVACRGNENKCIKITQKISLKGVHFSYVMYGCATENVCATPNNIAYANGTIQTKVYCRDPCDIKTKN
ncbi:phospholipase A2 inhibitor 25 kDa subunit-like [Rhinophrynus dorsalis]